MIRLIQVGDEYNVPVKQFYVDSEEEDEQIEGASVGSIAMILSNYVKMQIF